jgi:long-chain acyl-CoA synthetase
VSLRQIDYFALIPAGMVEELHLDGDDLFSVVRGLLYAEKKRLHSCSDIFGEELELTPESRPDRDPLNLSAAKIGEAARTVTSFFTREETVASRLIREKTIGNWASLIARQWGEKPEFIAFFTSGSTGAPQPVRRHFCFLEHDAFFCPLFTDPFPALSPRCLPITSTVLSTMS